MDSRRITRLQWGRRRSRRINKHALEPIWVHANASMGPPTISADQRYRLQPARGAGSRAKIANLTSARVSRAIQLPSSYPLSSKKSSLGAEFSCSANLPAFRHRFRFALLTPKCYAAYTPVVDKHKSPSYASPSRRHRVLFAEPLCGTVEIKLFGSTRTAHHLAPRALQDFSACELPEVSWEQGHLTLTKATQRISPALIRLTSHRRDRAIPLEGSMKPKRILASAAVMGWAAIAAGCGTPHPGHAASPPRSSAPSSSPVVIAEAQLHPRTDPGIQASATLVWNRENQTLTVSLDAAHLAPGRRYSVVLASESDATGPSQALGTVQADAHGEATWMTTVQQVAGIPSSGWQVELTYGSDVLASGGVHLVPMSGQVPKSLPTN